ncbi:MAG: serine/threonine-protein kinase [Pirellulaceae bacterium]
MAKVNSTKQLIELVRRSELVPKDRFAEFVATLASQNSGVLPGEADPLADRMVNLGLLTRWQMDQILRGKYRGFRLGKYTLKDHLGTGGMSSVYLSEHPIMRRPVAIKVLPKSRVTKSSYLERFELEARAVAALDHPNIVRAYDIDNEGDTHYIVMEYVEGRDFQRIVDQDGPMGFEQAAESIAQAARGLQHAHDAGVVHRDIKPANCLVDSAGIVKILDMGLVKFTDETKSLSSVHKDSVVGTADYLAPEQAVNSSKVDHRADIYGLGGTLYFLLMGHAPFPTGTLTERLLKHQKEEPESIFSKRPDAPPALVDICRRMMAKKPAERMQSASDVESLLTKWLEPRGIVVGAKSKSFSNAGGSNPTGFNRLEQILGTAKGSSGSSSERLASDTVSSRQGDTNRIDDDENEDFTLAPLEEDDDEVSHELSGSSAGSDAALSFSGEAADVDPETLSQIEQELSASSSTSGSLVDLFEDQHATSVSQSSILLTRKRKKTIPTGLIVGISVAAVAFLALAVIIINAIS